ncbi:40S ribosomal protein S3 [Anaeramoeba ignava]|uniref:40S ribosomal protein S3 n=1 Tax=Anaeramoeba ignava TaxID=1746090 RepID=A0A9Q0RFP2_ANAIG|nr:40S ribosomal protein S3 [Anaeramoeba ignava]
MTSEPTKISKKRKFINEGLFHAEVDSFFINHIAKLGYSGCRITTTPTRTNIWIQTTSPDKVAGDKGRKLRELTLLLQNRFNFPDGKVELYTQRVEHQFKKACYSAMRQIMDSGAKGCEIVVSGKLRGQRAKAMKFRDGYMLKTGTPSIEHVTKAVRHIKLKQGVLGVRVSIMLPYDPEEKKGGVTKRQPDSIHVFPPKDEVDAQTTEDNQN